MEIVLLWIAVTLLIGLLFGKLARAVRLPNVTGYLVGGVVLVLLFKLLRLEASFKEYQDVLNLIPIVALSFIAFSIGTEFEFSYVKQMGAKPLIIAIFGAVGATIMVLAGLLIVHFAKPDLISVNAAFLLSVIASATAPAATLMIIKQYKAQGDVTKTLISVVALDDAVGLILFGIVFAFVSHSGAGGNFAWLIIRPVLEVVASLALGVVCGFIVTWLLRWFTGRGNRLCVVLVFLLLVSALEAILSKTGFSISSLLVCMMIGAVFVNTNEHEKVDLVVELLNRFTPPFLILFFVLSGTSLELESLKAVGMVGIVYIITRMIGKIGGAWLGAISTKSSREVKKYLGYALIPQAGVALGLSLVATRALGSESNDAVIIRTVVLGATLIYELIGPLMSKWALVKSGDIKIEKKKKKALKAS